MSEPQRVIIVGAGPAGMAAAATLVRHGIRPIVIDQARYPGGQIYRRPEAPHGIDAARMLGGDVGAYERFHDEAQRTIERIDWRPRTSAWGLHEGALWTVSDGAITSLPHDQLLLATGATDRTLPIPGWTLPGVFTLGGAQVLLKGHGCAIGRRVVLCGSSPLLYLAAKQYLAAGANVTAILDTTALGRKTRAGRDLMRAPRTFAKGLGLMARVRAAGVPIALGVHLERFDGDGGVAAVVYRDRSGRQRRVACDAIAFGFGLKPEAQLADLAGVRFWFDARFRQWLPVTDEDGRARVDVYLAGDGATIGGAEAADISGTLAASALIEDRGQRVEGIDRPALRRRLTALRRFQHGLARAFAWPAASLAAIDDATILCRCEAITAGDLRRALDQELPPADVNRLKALTRVGMGRCQGRFCGLAAAELMAARSGRKLEACGRLRGQGPVTPLPASAVMEVP